MVPEIILITQCSVNLQYAQEQSHVAYSHIQRSFQVVYLAYREYETPLLTASKEIEEKESEQNWAPSSIASSSWFYNIKENKRLIFMKTGSKTNIGAVQS